MQSTKSGTGYVQCKHNLLYDFRYLLEKYGNFIDRDRVGVSGVSYGGYVAGMMLSETSQNHSTLLKCGVAVCPVVDWRYYGEQ